MVRLYTEQRESSRPLLASVLTYVLILVSHLGSLLFLLSVLPDAFVCFSRFSLTHFVRVSSVLEINHSKIYIHMLSFLIICLPPCLGSHTLVSFAFHTERGVQCDTCILPRVNL